MEICLKLEEANYDPLKPSVPASGVMYYQDSLVPFLRLKVTAKGARTWVFDKSFQGRHLKRQIGSALVIGMPEARMRACEWAKDLETDGKLPPTLEERQKLAPTANLTVGDAFLRYYDSYAELQCRTEKEIKRGFDKYWDLIRTLSIVDLQPRIVQDWINHLATTHGKATAQKQYNSLRASIKWCVNQSFVKIAFDPFAGVKGFKSDDTIRYLHQGDEARNLYAALCEESKDVRDAVMMLLLTGQRKTNVLSMEWAEVDLTASTWHVPAHKTKSKRSYSVALTQKAIAILETRSREGNLVFPAVTKRKKDYLSIEKAWRRLRSKSGISGLKIHGLRHTMATWLALNGASAMVIQRALNHSNIATSQKYVHLVSNDARHMLELSQQAI